MKVVSGSFNGTGATVYICLGFIPDFVNVFGSEDAELATVRWSANCRAAESVGGWLEHGGDQTTALYTAGTGIEPYEGGDVLTSTNQTSVAYGEGVYLGWDLQNYARNATYGFVTNEIDTWTLDTSGNRTGHFNDDVPASVSRIGEGSRISILETNSGVLKEAVIEALTAGQGVSADEVTLSRAVKAGAVRHISGMYSMAPIAVGQTTKQGFVLYATTDINVNDEIQYFEAGCYDMRG